MAATVADMSEERLSELIYYLSGSSRRQHPEDEHEPPEYWELMAEYLRKEDSDRFSSYTEERLASMNARSLLHDLAKRGFRLNDLKELLRKKCPQALNVFEDATRPTLKCQPAANIDVIEGHPIALDVEAFCHPGQPQYQWFKEQNPIPEQDKPTLLIKNATVANSGQYICRVTNPFIRDKQKATNFSDYVRVTVLGKKDRTSSNPRIVQEVGYTNGPQAVSTPKIIRHPAPLSARLNTRVELECSAEGAAVYDWYKDGKLVKPTNQNGKLVIDNVSLSNRGQYHCVAISSQGGKVESQQAELTVDVGIKIVKQPEDIDVKVNHEFRLVCKATNVYNKEMKYEWFRNQVDGESYVGEGEEFCREASTSRSVKWKFFCKVSFKDNPKAFVKSNEVKVKVKTVWITEHPTDVKQVIGSRAILHCKAVGVEDDIKYRWLKSDTKDGKPTKCVSCEPFEWYVIDHLAQKHWGYYFCQAENSFESAVSRKVHVSALLPNEATLSRRTKRLQPQPLIKIVKHPWNQVVPLGGRFRLLCEAVSSGDERLQYQWCFNAKPIPGETRSIFIREKTGNSDYGPYWCLVNTSSTNQVTVSTTARIEQSERESRLASKSGNFDQLKAEEQLKTLKEERFARMKVALLIGNQRYEAEDLNDLKSPEGDIKALTHDLECLDFKVISLVNLSHEETMKALEVFYQMLAVPGIYALFYYSGHGFSTQEGRNYIIPVDATLPLHLEHNIHVDGIIRNMQEKFSRAFVILDCCRSRYDNPIPEEHHSFGSLVPEGVASMANYAEISSCVDNFTAGDSIGEGAGPSSPTTGVPESSHSFFNIAFREALKKKVNIHTVFEIVTRKFIDSGMIQRPLYKGSMADEKITLHDAVMMDDPLEHEKTLNGVLTTYNNAHAAPDDIVISGEKALGELANLARLEVEFRNEFSNVLCVVTTLVLLQNDKTSTVKMVYDTEFISRQFQRSDDVIIEQDDKIMTCLMSGGSEAAGQLDDPDEEGGQGEYESFYITLLKVFNIQRLPRSREPKIKFFLTATIHTQGVNKKCNIPFEVPLRKHLLN